MMTPRALSSAAADERVVDVEEELRDVVVPVEMADLVGPDPGRRDDRERAGAVGRQVEGLVDRRDHDPLRIEDAGDPRLEAEQRRHFAMDQEELVAERQALFDPRRKLRPVGMAGIEVDGADAGLDLERLALDADLGGAVLDDAAERALRLEADEQHRRLRRARSSS